MGKLLKYFRATAFVLSAMIAVQCADGGLSEDQFVDLYVKLAIARESYRANPQEWPAERTRIVAQAHTSPAALQAFIERHREKPEQWTRIWEKIVQRVEALRQKESS